MYSLACLISSIVLNLGIGQETLLNLVVKGLSLVLFNYHVEYKSHAAMESFEKVQIRFCLQALICALLFATFLKSPTPNYGWRKQSKCMFNSDLRFEVRAEYEISEFEISRFDCRKERVIEFELYTCCEHLSFCRM